MSDREQIQDLLTRYSYSISVRDFDTVATLFTPDASWELFGHPEMKTKFKGPSLPEGIKSIVVPTSSLIQMNSPALIEVNGDRATTAFTVNESGDIKATNQYFTMFGRYNDEVVKVNGKWLFEARRFTILNLRMTPLNP